MNFMQKIKYLRGFIQPPLLIILILFISIAVGISYKVFKGYNILDTIDISEAIKECYKIQDQTDKDHCYNYVAQTKKDTSICDKIQDQTYKDGCYIGVVAIKKDPSICDKIQDQTDEDNCYIYVAQVKQDLSICDKIQYQADRDYCCLLYTSPSPRDGLLSRMPSSA